MRLSSDIITSSQWVRIGVMFGAQPWRQTPDLERLLLDTAAQVPDNPRLLTMGVTWLARYSDFVARHRLRQMVIELGDSEASAVMGLLLETVKSYTRSDALDMVLSQCRPWKEPRPLLIVDRRTQGMIEFVKERASEVSKRWGLWVEQIELHEKALRPLNWIMQKNPTFQARAVFSGGLRTSILACLRYDAKGHASEAHLARLCGVTRKAIHEALDHLELCNMITRRRAGRSYEVALRRRMLRVAG